MARKKTSLFFVLYPILFALLFGVGFFLWRLFVPPSTRQFSPSPSSSLEQTLTPSPPIRSTSLFTPLQEPPIPSFLGKMEKTQEIEIGLSYEPPEGNWNNYPVYKDPQTRETMRLLPNKSDEREYEYGSPDFSIFRAEESHAYQGTPIYVTSRKGKYAMEYLGLKISDRNLISAFQVELGIDYGSEDYNKSSCAPGRYPAVLAFFGLKSAHACGPGVLLRHVGKSPLVFVQEEKGVFWYRLQKSIRVYPLPLNYCDRPTKREEDYCVGIDDFKNGNLRMHLLFRPNNQKGKLSVQLANVIFKNGSGVFVHPQFGENYSSFYQAYLAPHCSKNTPNPDPVCIND